MCSLVPVQLWLQRIVASLLLLAVGTTSALGTVAGYRCDCGPQPRLVPTPDCHQDACHPGHHHDDGCDSDTDHLTGGADHSHRHSAVFSQVDWPKAGTDFTRVTPLQSVTLPPIVREFFVPESFAFRDRLPKFAPSPPSRRLFFLTSLLLI